MELLTLTAASESAFWKICTILIDQGHYSVRKHGLDVETNAFLQILQIAQTYFWMNESESVQKCGLRV